MAAAPLSAAASRAPRLFGVIEGFYGRPWTRSQRLQLLGQLGELGLNCFVYAPKDDRKHRAFWRELYSEAEAAELRELVEACRAQRATFVYAIAPGLDMVHSSAQENEALRAKTAQVFELGCRAVAVLFDDIPAKMVDADRAVFASVAEAQCHVANTLLSALEALAASRGEAPPRLLFCPTEYCQSMAKHEHMRSPYLEAVGRLLRDEIDVFWTGPAIISEKLPAAHLAQVASVLRRPPMIWDNLFANDYDSRRTFLGPYDGRDAATAAAVRGVVINPNCEFELNFVALRTFARFVREPATYAPAEALATARDEWRRRMGVGGGRVVGEEEAGLLCDLFFLPHRHGPRAARLLDLVAAAIARKARGESDGGDEARELASLLQSVERLFVLVTELEDRPLCYALYRYLWTVKEECIAVERFLAHAAPDPSGRLALRSAEFPPRVFRGGFIADLQRLLEFERDGALCAAPLAK